MKSLAKTLVLSDGFEATTAAWYSPHYRMRSRKIYPWMKTAMEVFTKELSLPENLKVIIKPLKGKKLGLYVPLFQNIYMDPKPVLDDLIDSRGTRFRIFRTLAHECVHAEQFQRGTMHFRDEGGKKRLYWEDIQVGKMLAQASPAEYNNLPWEKEAMDREKVLAEKAYEVICSI